MKNLTFYEVGDIYITTSSENPATRWLGTTWEKIEGKFLKSTSGSEQSETTGGSNTKTLSQDNLPAVKLKIDSFSVSRGTMDITGTFPNDNFPTSLFSGAFYRYSDGKFDGPGSTGDSSLSGFKASRSWTGSSTAVAPQTSTLGQGQALDITPAFYSVHIWKRLS